MENILTKPNVQWHCPLILCKDHTV